MEQRLFSVEHLLEGIRGSSEATKLAFYENDHTGGAVWYVPPSKEVPAHYHPGADEIWLVLEGEGEYYLGNGETHPLFPGLVAVAPAGALHGILCTGYEPLVFVAIAGPLPAETVKAAN